jgi:hypothetical protein
VDLRLANTAALRRIDGREELVQLLAGDLARQVRDADAGFLEEIV